MIMGSCQALTYLLSKSRVFTGDLAACNLKLQRNKLELPSGGHCYKLQPQHLSTSVASRQCGWRGCRWEGHGAVPGTPKHCLQPLGMAGSAPAQPGGTSLLLLSPAARVLTPATNLAFGCLDCCYLIYGLVEDTRGGSASRQPSSVFSGPLCSACRKRLGPSAE